MPTISYDGQSFSLDGRRIWLVSGSIHYSRTPRQLWLNRIRAAKQAGLNCIETYVFWNLHEPQPGRFDFTGDNDIRHFVRLIADQGMYCILRPGPYVCAEWDFGGLPPWLLRIPGIKLRQSHPAFLEACSRYLTAVMGQVKDLQINAPNSTGSLLMVQAENEWFCSNPPQDKKPGEAYLSEIVRYLREAGCTVPINSCNNLWQRVEGAIDTWNSASNLPADLRQLHVVRPQAPRIVTEFWPGWFDSWNNSHQTPQDPDLMEYKLAGILAVGAQYNFYMFHGGTNFGFYGGRSVASDACFMTTSYDYDAPLSEAGGRGPKYFAAKRISTFASHFGFVFAHLEPDYQPVTLNPSENDHPLNIIHQRGSQGDVVFLLRAQADKTSQVELLLPNGLKLPVPIGPDRVAWLVLNVRLPGSVELTYCNVRPLAFIARKMLVLFGPAGATALLSLNQAPITLQVPAAGDAPLITAHEGLTVVLLNRAQADAAWPLAESLVLGAAGLDENDQPLAHPVFSQTLLIQADGTTTAKKIKTQRRPSAPKLSAWQYAPLTDILAGQSPDFKPIAGPASLEALSCDFGYGWYRLSLPASAAVTPVMAPQAADRLHLFQNSKPLAILGLGPQADINPQKLRLDQGNLVVLADNLGRYNFGWNSGEQKGLFGHLYSVKPQRLGKPKITDSQSPDPFVLSDFWVGLRAGQRRPASTLAWSIPNKGKQPWILNCHQFPRRTMVFFNDQPLGLLAGGVACSRRFVLQPKVGKNTLALALFEKYETPVDLNHYLTLYQTTATLSEQAQWAFAPWSTPQPDAFAEPPRTVPALPAWHRATFSVAHTDQPLWLELIGLTKGQLFLNDHNVGRYFVATAKGKKVPPQTRYYLPEPWLKTDASNELMIFDEHGQTPRQCRLAYDPLGPYPRTWPKATS
ncbi:MAG: beta-galactosidase [Phycisphaeraceae bacterium]|nr:beta-galactosidase [Phycisphaeraceae bacterium]